MTEQLDVFGQSITLDELELRGRKRALSPDEQTSRQTKVGQTKTCEGCGRAYQRGYKDDDRLWARRRHCSRDCRYRGPGVVARVMTEETRLHTKGYVMVFCPWHPGSMGGWVYDHRLIAERGLDRFLEPSEHVHHINEDVADNRPANLQVVSPREHHVIHAGTPQDHEVAEMIRAGKTSREIVALGVSSHRVVRVRRELVDVTGPTCESCGRLNPAGATFCRGCGLIVDDPEPTMASYDPATAPFPEGY